MNYLPHMEPEGLKFFQDQLQRSSCYLEYGCGGSTLYAINDAQVKTILSIDTDLNWIQRIRSYIPPDSSVYIEHLNLGEVADWGFPQTINNYKDFHLYTSLPWSRATELKVVPDTILIDGRFRVACFLYSLLAARIGTMIIFDDYFDRPEYFIVEEFCEVTEKAGRMAGFIIKKEYNIRKLVSLYSKYTLDWS